MTVLVAGLGNVLFGDDGFGVVVAERLAAMELPDYVQVRSFGVRGRDMTYALMDGVTAAVIVDAVGLGHAPGTLVVLDPEQPGATMPTGSHGFDPVRMLQTVEAAGCSRPRLRLVGCEPQRIMDAEEGLAEGLSAVVAGAVPRACALVLQTAAALVEGAVAHA